MSEVRIQRLAIGGDGVGRLADGRAVFVPRTAPGDLVALREIREHRRFARARVASVLEPGPDRVQPRCPHYTEDECGGCQLQHLSEPAQREARRSFVGDALRRLARREISDPPLTPADRTFGYRAKLTLAVSRDGRRLGLHRVERADRIFDLVHCHIAAIELMELWSVLRPLRRLLPDGLDRLVLRLDRRGGRHLIARVRGTTPWLEADRLHAGLRAGGIEATVWWRPEGGAARAVAGATEPYPATVFEQVHPVMGDLARAHALKALLPVRGRHVWDLYAGIGETTAALVEAGATVESVEWDRRAVAEAERRGPAAVRHAAGVEDVVDRLRRPDLVLTNPPRTGMDRRVADRLEELGPDRVVYLSCDPATLARDLTRMPGFRLGSVRAFDLFPQTAHVETVAVLERAL